MKKLQSVIAGLLVAVLTLGTVACTPPTISNLVTALGSVADAASVAVVITSSLAATGTIPPEDAATVSKYAQEVASATTKSINELNSTDSNTVKATVVTEAFSTLTAPVFGANAAPQIVAVTAAVNLSIQFFVRQLRSYGALKLAATAAPYAEIKLEKGDKAKLKEILTKSASTSAQAVDLVN